jgi:hypothetical protein
MFLQYIQSHLSELPDISQPPQVDSSRLATPLTQPTANDIDFLWEVLRSARVNLNNFTKQALGSGINNGDIALNSIQTMAPGLKRYVSFYQEEDFYI